MKKRQSELDEFEDKLAIPRTCPMEIENRSKVVLNMPPAVLRGLTKEQCCEDAYVLQQFGFYLQKAANREQSTITMADSALRRVVGKHIDQVQGYGLVEKTMKVVRQNEVADKFDKMKTDAQARLDRISYLSQKAEGMSKTLMCLAKAKGVTHDSD